MLTFDANLAARARTPVDSISTRICWDTGHGANKNADAFVDCVVAITGHPGARSER